MDGGIEAIIENICMNYCKYPDNWDEEKEGVELSESDICRNCPLNELEKAADDPGRNAGRWVELEVYGHTTWECSECGWEVYSKDGLTNYCPSCGVKMKGDKT